MHLEWVLGYVKLRLGAANFPELQSYFPSSDLSLSELVELVKGSTDEEVVSMWEKASTESLEVQCAMFRILHNANLKMGFTIFYDAIDHELNVQPEWAHARFGRLSVEERSRLLARAITTTFPQEMVIAPILSAGTYGMQCATLDAALRTSASNEGIGACVTLMRQSGLVLPANLLQAWLSDESACPEALRAICAISDLGDAECFPLHWAVTESAVEILVEAGASLDKANCENETPLLCAVNRRNRAVFSALLGCGALPDDRVFKAATRQYELRAALLEHPQYLIGFEKAAHGASWPLSANEIHASLKIAETMLKQDLVLMMQGESTPGVVERMDSPLLGEPTDPFSLSYGRLGEWIGLVKEMWVSAPIESIELIAELMLIFIDERKKKQKRHRKHRKTQNTH
jgi:hypothetical protein